MVSHRMLDASGVPKYLYLHCGGCGKIVKSIDISITRDDGVYTRESNLQAPRVVEGTCVHCGGVLRESIEKDSDIQQIVKRAVAHYEKSEKRRRLVRKVRSKQEMSPVKKARGRTVRGKAKATAKTAARKPAAKSKETVERVRHYDRSEGQPTQREAFALAMSGDLYSVDEVQERFNELVKKGVVGSRDKDIVTGDLSYMCNLGEFPVGDRTVEAYRSRDEEGNDIFGVPQLPDALKKGARAGKIVKKGSKLSFKGLQLVKKRKDLS